MSTLTNCRQTNDFNCIKIKFLPILQIVYPMFYAQLPLDSNNLIFNHTGINFARCKLTTAPQSNQQTPLANLTTKHTSLIAANHSCSQPFHLSLSAIKKPHCADTDTHHHVCLTVK